MKQVRGQLRLGIVGCGAIGTGIALSTTRELKTHFMLSAVYDIEPSRSRRLSTRLRARGIVKKTLKTLINASDVVVECVNTPATVAIVRETLKARKNILVLSIGRLLEESGLFLLAERQGAAMLLPSGAIAGLDAIKAARLAGITRATLTTTKPLQGFKDNAFLIKKGMDVSAIRKDTVLFSGCVDDAVKRFPQNINVAAALALAVGDARKVRVRIVASPATRRNIHEIVIEGVSGRIVTRVENEACPDNPKTSYLAVLSAIAALKQFGQHVKIGT